MPATMTAPRSSAGLSSAQLALDALALLRRVGRPEIIQFASYLCDRPWVAQVLRACVPGMVIVLGRFDRVDEEGVRWPRILIEARRPAARTPPQCSSHAYVGVYPDMASGGSWICASQEGGSYARSAYAGDPNGAVSMENGDLPWIMPGASDEAILRGRQALRGSAGTGRARNLCGRLDTL